MDWRIIEQAIEDWFRLDGWTVSCHEAELMPDLLLKPVLVTIDCSAMAKHIADLTAPAPIAK